MRPDMKSKQFDTHDEAKEYYDSLESSWKRIRFRHKSNKYDVVSGKPIPQKDAHIKQEVPEDPPSF